MAKWTYSTSCARCGCRTHAEFCMDCKAVDPEMTKDGMNAKTMYKHRTRHERRFREFVSEIYRVSGRG